jgi:rSAM/selenodomain-associated transferase 1
MPHPRLIIFARYPLPGRTKTRLIPELGEAGAARLQDAMTRHTLQQAAALARRRRVEVEVRCTGASIEAMRERYGGGFAYAEQGDGDLGDRLSRAAIHAATPPRPVVIIGADCPSISAETIHAAFDALAEHDIVLGPALDGGYYLLGLRRFVPALFQGISWSTSEVLAQTRDAAARAGLSCAMLQPLGDVDRPGDLPACADLLNHTPPPYRPSRLAITGATGALGRRFLAHLLDTVPEVRVTALVRGASRAAEASEFRRLIEVHTPRLTLLNADLETLELTPAQRRSLAETDGGLWHFAASTALDATSPDVAAKVTAINEGGTARLLALLAGSDRPGPFYHLSTAYVCGRRTGVVREHELSDAAGFRNAYERSKHAAEARVRAALQAGLPGLILRPSLVVSGESMTCPNDLPSALAAGLRAASATGRRLALRMPRTAGVNAVPAEWVTRALIALAPYANTGRTYHLTNQRETTFDEFAGVAGRLAKVEVHPVTAASELSRHDRVLDRLLRPFGPYFESDVQFDRRNLDLDAPELSVAPEVDLEAVMKRRLEPRRSST